MKTALLILLIIILCGCTNGQGLKKTKHGWAGKYLTASRMALTLPDEPEVKNLAFSENQFMGMIDREEVSKIIEKNNGWILEGDAFGLGIVMFNGMNTKAKQDSVIKKVLPQLEKWYEKQLRGHK